MLNRELRFVQLNHQLAGLSAKPLSEQIGRTLWEIAPGIARQLEPLCRQVMASGKPVLNREIRATAPATMGMEGRWFASCYPYNSDEGRLDGVSLVVQETNGPGPTQQRNRAPHEANAARPAGVTERRGAEALLRGPESLLALADATPAMVWVTDVGKQCVYCNQRLLAFTGRTLEQEAGNGWLGGIHPDDVPACRETFYRAFDARVGFSLECRLRRVDGEYRWVLDAGVPHAWPDGAFAGYIGFCLDIADRKQAEQALRNREERHALATAAGQVGIWDWDLETNEVYVDPVVKTILGFEDYEIQNRIDAWGLRIHPDDRELMITAARDYLEGRAAQFEMEHRMLCKDGGIRWFLARGSAIRDESGKALRLTGTDTDITERKLAGQERRRLEQRVLQAELEQRVQRAQKLESLSVLAGGMAHDFNNLLVGILGNASLALMELPAQSPVRPFVEQIEKAGRHAADLTKQMLAYSGKGRFVVGPLNLSRLVAEMTHLLQSVISNGVVLEYDLAGRLPPIRADATQLRQVAMNLIANGSDAIGDRSGVVKITTGEVEADPNSLLDAVPDSGFPGGRSVFLEVSDSGCGMDASTQSRIFDPFFSTKVTGRGLGLAAVLGIVRGHRGAIQLQSQPGHGTTFRVLFPVSHEELL